MIPMNAAARRPADGDVVISDVMRYDARAVKPEHAGARSTHMFRMSIGIDRRRRTW